MLESDEPVNLLVMRPQQPPAATPRTPGTASHLEPPVDLNPYIDALPPLHTADLNGRLANAGWWFGQSRAYELGDIAVDNSVRLVAIGKPAPQDCPAGWSCHLPSPHNSSTF